MEKVEYIEENENGAAVIDVMKTSERSCPYRYTKVGCAAISVVKPRMETRPWILNA